MITSRYLRNKSYISKMKTYKTKIMHLLTSSEKDTINKNEVLKIAKEYEKINQSGVNKGILHKNKSIRNISRIYNTINKTFI